jgi:hypothetical protein
MADTTVTISANDPPMPKLHLKPKPMPMPPHTTTAHTVTVTDSVDITDTVTDSAMADTTDITPDILMLTDTDMATISANVTLKPMLPQLPMPMPPHFTSVITEDMLDILMLMELIPHTTPDITLTPMP